MPRVLFVHHRPQLGGAVKSLSLLISALDSRWEPHAIAPEGPAADLLREAGATVHPSPVPAFTHTWDVQYRGLRWLVFGRELTAAPKHVRVLRTTLREVQPDVVHVNDSVMLLSGALAARAGFPVLWHLRSALAQGGADRRSRWICALLEGSGRAAIAIDDDVAATFTLGIPIHSIPNPALAEPGPTLDLGAPRGAVTIGWIGYLRQQKGWPEFLKALRMLLDRGASVHGVVVGGPIRPHAAFRGVRGRGLEALGVLDEEQYFDRMVCNLDLRDHLTRLPFAKDPDPIYRALDIVVFPNQGVGLGRPVLEAAAHGKPVVASGSRHGGGVLLPGQTGMLLPRGTPEELAETLHELVIDEELRSRLGSQAQDLMRRLHTPSVYARAVEEVYHFITPRGDVH